MIRAKKILEQAITGQIDHPSRIKLLSPRDLAAAIGVSESSIKRWVDDGRIDAIRTAGGHRRIPLPEAIRFVRETRAVLLEPQVLGLGNVARLRDATAGIDAATAFYDFLRQGAIAEASGTLISLYLDGASVAELIDGPVRQAMTELGELWHGPLGGDEGIFVEHRATEMCLQALQQLRQMLPSHIDGPVAVGGAPTGDSYLLPSLAAAMVLTAEGFHAINLGPQTPLAALRKAVATHRPRLVWLSVSIAPNPDALAAEIGDLAAHLHERRAVLAVGGRRSAELDLDSGPALFQGATMAELAAFARGLALRP